MHRVLQRKLQQRIALAVNGSRAKIFFRASDVAKSLSQPCLTRLLEFATLRCVLDDDARRAAGWLLAARRFDALPVILAMSARTRMPLQFRRAGLPTFRKRWFVHQQRCRAMRGVRVLFSTLGATTVGTTVGDASRGLDAPPLSFFQLLCSIGY
jgi:hypothetical protein